MAIDWRRTGEAPGARCGIPRAIVPCFYVSVLLVYQVTTQNVSSVSNSLSFSSSSLQENLTEEVLTVTSTPFSLPRNISSETVIGVLVTDSSVTSSSDTREKISQTQTTHGLILENATSDRTIPLQTDTPFSSFKPFSPSSNDSPAEEATKITEAILQSSVTEKINEISSTSLVDSLGTQTATSVFIDKQDDSNFNVSVVSVDEYTTGKTEASTSSKRVTQDKTITNSSSIVSPLQTDDPVSKWFSSPIAIPLTQTKNDMNETSLSPKVSTEMTDDHSTDHSYFSTSEKNMLPFVSNTSPEYTDNDLPISLDPMAVFSSRVSQSSQDQRIFTGVKDSDPSTNALESVTGFEDIEVSSTELLPETFPPTEDLPIHIPLDADLTTTLASSTMITTDQPSSETFTTLGEISQETDEKTEEDLDSTTIELVEISSSNETLSTEKEMPFQPREPEISKHYDSMTENERSNSVTVMFIAPSNMKMDIYWDSERDRLFRYFVSAAVSKFINEQQMNSEEQQTERVESVTPEQIVYVNPSPISEGTTIHVVFFLRNHSSQDTDDVIPANTIVSALSRRKDFLQEQMGLNVTMITTGIIMLQWSSPFFVRHAVVFISLIAVAFFCILIIIIALIYIRCRNNRRGKWDKTGEYGDKKKLKKDMKMSHEIGDLQSEREIQNDEGKSGYLNGNGNHVVALDDEGWVIPFEEVVNIQPPQKVDSEDTKL